MTQAGDIKVGQYIKTAYSSVEVIKTEYKMGWIKIWYKCKNGYEGNQPWNFRFSHPIQTVPDFI